MNEIHTHLYYDTLEVIYQQKRSVSCPGGIFDLTQVEQRQVSVYKRVEQYLVNKGKKQGEKDNKNHHLFGEL